MAEPDYFLPAIFSLDSSNVHAIQTSKTDPKIVLDATGLSLPKAPYPGDHVATSKVSGVTWIDAPNGGKIAAQVFGTSGNPARDSDSSLIGIAQTPGNRTGGIYVGVSDTDPSKNIVAADLPATGTRPGAGVIIFDGFGKSSFMRLLNVQRLLGESEVYAGPWPGASVLNPIPRNAASSHFFSMTHTANLDEWWYCTFNMGIVAKNDAAYNYIYTGLVLSPADMDGLTTLQYLHTQHNGVNVYEHHHVDGFFRLQSGVTYTLNAAWLGGSGGSWSTYVGPTEAQMQALAFQQQ